MSLCINPRCPDSQNPDNILFCQTCGSELLLQSRYRVVNGLGGGGFGVTFAVKDLRSNAPKALKVLTQSEPRAIELFQQEAQVLAQLNHPGIPQVEPDSYFVYFPRDSQQSLHCLVMEKIEGLDLYEYMKQRDFRPIDQNSAVQWLTEIVTILQQVHSQNFFHRDIKPPNIMLRATGQLVLIDFGTARAVTQTYWFAQAQGNVTGIISAGYTPPEQFNHQAVPQSDFFALGRTFIFLLTGKEPTDPAIYDSYTAEIRWRNYAGEILPQLADLIDWMMAHSPSQRPANTQIILQRLAEIDQILNTRQPRYTPPVFAAPSVPATKQVSQSPPAVTQPAKIGWGFLLKWILATTVGVVMGAVVGLVVGAAVGNVNAGNTVAAAIAGTFVGIMQWLVLRRQIYQAGWWVLATAVGFAVFGAVANALIGAVFGAVFNALIDAMAGAVLGIFVGIMQWLVLRRQIYQAGWWVLATAVGFAVFGAAFNTVTGAGAGAILGLITGLTLVKLLRNRFSKP
ncbi:protein kinase [Chlorogloeopsis sp. ULAP01]|uniref:protein kinase domain-containing protein n=1 Tax=Chlorogloeopsis sp. ULAP01 TaxID=3056483 RepID=UPI0025AA9BC3|nr:protein kinase [Chlorogloeopsis sp. ULAP01]MDM9385035.1 protein kinase [Chlorogloeopsis sp. ULAP01]